MGLGVRMGAAFHRSRDPQDGRQPWRATVRPCPCLHRARVWLALGVLGVGLGQAVQAVQVSAEPAEARPDATTTTPPAAVGPQEAPQRWLTSGGWTAAELQATAQRLRSKHPQRRLTALDALGSLRADSLPALSERVAQLHAEVRSAESLSEVARLWESSPPPPTRAGYRAAAERLLTERRGDDARAFVEALTLLQALANMHTVDADLLMSEWVDLYEGALRPALDELTTRDGNARLPALLRLRSHPDPELKHWAQAHIKSLKVLGPAAALQQQDPALLADVVTAYSLPLDFAAMPLLVRQTAHPSTLVRDAARAAVGRFGHNAIWQLREFYEEWTGRSLPSGLAVTEARDVLYAAVDRERLQRESQWLLRAQQALKHNDLLRAQAQLDGALAEWPSRQARAGIAPAYLALARAALARDDLATAVDSYQVLLWLTPDDAQPRAIYESELTFVQAEYDLTHGIADAAAYHGVLTIQPQHEGAAHALSQLSAHHRGARRGLLFILLSLLSLSGSGAFLLAWRKTLRVRPRIRRTAAPQSVMR